METAQKYGCNCGDILVRRICVCVLRGHVTVTCALIRACSGYILQARCANALSSV